MPRLNSTHLLDSTCTSLCDVGGDSATSLASSSTPVLMNFVMKDYAEVVVRIHVFPLCIEHEWLARFPSSFFRDNQQIMTSYWKVLISVNTRRKSVAQVNYDA